MGIESWKKRRPTEEEKKSHGAFKEADPTTYSLLNPTTTERKFLAKASKPNISIRQSRGETFYKTTNLHDPRGQQAVARLLKGILNVSDIVTVPNKAGEAEYFSWELPLDRVQGETTKEQVLADQVLLTYIFNSKDHLYNPQNGWGNNVRYHEGKAAHFDFGEDAYRFLDTPEDRGGLHARIEGFSPETKQYLKEKLVALQDRFEGEEGRAFFDSVIASIDAPVTELFGPKETFEAFPDKDPQDLAYTVLIGRIERFLSRLGEFQTEEKEAA